MHLEQFDKLKKLVKQLIDKSRETRFTIARLKKENSELKLQLEQIRNLPENVNEEFLNNLLTENERLKDKNQTARNHLGNIVSTLEHGDLRQINGVDS